MTTNKLTPADLIDRVRALAPGIAARARRAELARKPDDDSIRELADAGVFALLVPRALGGHEFDLDTHAAVVHLISSACMSTGWVAAFYIGHNWMLTKFSERAQREVLAARPYAQIPIQPSPGVSIKAVAGGYEISGRSAFSSGIMHADWVIIAKAGGDDARAFVVPVADVKVEDTWNMSGMAATGSNDVIVDDLFVPEYRTLPAVDLFNSTASIHDNPLYRIPLLAFIYCEVLGVYCGGLAGATAAYDEYVHSKVMTWGGEPIAGKQASHVNLGAAHARSLAMNALLDRHVADTRALARAGGFTIPARIELKLRAGYVADQCREGVNDLMARVGTRTFALDAPLQRYFRDMNTICSHAFLDWEVAREQYGRQRLGLAPNHPLL